jgi:hypothetical protein
VNAPTLRRNLFRIRMVTSWVIAAARLYVLLCAFMMMGAIAGLALLFVLGFAGVPIASTWLTAFVMSFPGFVGWTMYRRRRASRRPSAEVL